MKLAVTVCSIAALLFSGLVYPRATKRPAELAAIIADRIISQTPYAFVNTKSKETYQSLKDVPFSMDIKVQSQYNDWHYTNGVLGLAMLELSDKLNDKTYEDYVSRNMEFVFDSHNLAYFKRQYDEAFARNRWKGIRSLSWHMIFRNKRLDDNGPMGASLIELQMRKPEQAYLNYINSTEEHVMSAEPRLEDGTIARIWPHENTIWADDLFMGVSFLCRMGKLTGNVKYFDDAANQVLNYNKYLWHSEKQIYYHCRHTDTGEYGVAHWSRANGWMLMAQADLLTMLPDNHPKREALIRNFKQQVSGVARYQGKNGLWRQLLDKEDSYEEITGTAMFVFGIARGVRKGWLHEDFIHVAEQGLRGIMSKLTDAGDVTAICVGTGIMPSLAYYYNRPVRKNIPMGEGPVLRALIEMSDIVKYSDQNSADSQYDKF
jgi:rhamnogalacturonyl hydrolase YesR